MDDLILKILLTKFNDVHSEQISNLKILKKYFDECKEQ